MANSNQKNKVMGVLAYLGVLIIIPILVAKNEPFVKFHIKQGLVLLVIEVVAWVAAMAIWPLWLILWLVKLIIFVFVVLGIINVIQGKEKNLPWVGSYARYFTF